MKALILSPVLQFKADLYAVASKSQFFNLVAQIIIYMIYFGGMALGMWLTKWSTEGGLIVAAIGPVVGFWLFNNLPESRLGRQSKRARHSPPRNGMPFELFILTGSRLN
jgi:hypothetical protein